MKTFKVKSKVTDKEVIMTEEQVAALKSTERPEKRKRLRSFNYRQKSAGYDYGAAVRCGISNGLDNPGHIRA